MRIHTLVGIAVFLLSSLGWALPPVGGVAPSAKVVDANDRPFNLAEVQGKPILLVYEDKESATLNAALKKELARLARGEQYRSSVALVPVADVHAYDFWPARGFVKDAIKSESKAIGATIYCDWDLSFARTLGITRNTSSVVLLGRDRRVLFSVVGKASEEDTRRLVELLRREVEAS